MLLSYRTYCRILRMHSKCHVHKKRVIPVHHGFYVDTIVPDVDVVKAEEGRRE